MAQSNPIIEGVWLYFHATIKHKNVITAVNILYFLQKNEDKPSNDMQTAL